MGKFFKEFASFSFFTLISRIFGFARDIVIANKIGASAASDIFFVALKFPNFFRRIFAEGALSQSFVPLYSEELNKSKLKARKFASEILFFVSIAILLLTILVELFTAQIILIFAPGFVDNADKFAAVIEAARITFPYLFFISVVSFYSSLLYAHGRFAAGAVVPVIFNLSLIIATIFFVTDSSNVTVILSYGLLIAGIVQLLFLVICVAHKKLFVLPRIVWSLSPQTREFFKRLFPAAFAASIVQLNVWVDMIFASYIPNSVSYLYYAERLVQLPLALIGTALGIVLLPRLSKLLTQKQNQETIIATEKAVLLGLFLALPASLGLWVLATEIFQSLFMRGEFTFVEVIACSEAMQILAIAMPAYVMIKINLPHFHARGDMKTPLLVSSLGIVINIILNYLLMQKYSYLGIAMATVVSAWCNYFLFHLILRKRSYVEFSSDLFKSFVKFIISASAMCVVGNVLANYWQEQISLGGIVAMTHLIIILVVALIVYFGLSFLLLGKQKMQNYLRF